MKIRLRSLIITLIFLVSSAIYTASALEIVVISGKKYVIHRVIRGETLYSLSRRYNVTIDAMKAANRVELANGLIAGTRIKIPYRGQTILPAQPPVTPTATPTTTPQSQAQTQVKPQPQTQPEPQQSAPVVEPKVEVAEQPKAETPVVETPKAETPKAETPKAVEPTPVVETPAPVAEPKVEEVKVVETPAPAVVETPVVEPKEAPAPVVETPKPVVETPVVETQKPVVETPAPVAETPAPVVEPKAEVAPVQTAPIVETPAPAVETKVEEKPTVVETPIVETPAAAVVETPSVDAQPIFETPTTAPASGALFRRLNKGDVAEVALMLPLGSTDSPARNYIDFYRGFLMGLDSVRMSGISVNLHLYNTAHNPTRVSKIIESGALDKVDLVVGPVYEDEMIPVVNALDGKGKPIVSPLARLKQINNDAVFQMSPSMSTKYDKITDLLDANHRIVIVSTDDVDKKFDREVRELLRGVPNVIEHKYIYEHPTLVARRAYERAKAHIQAPGDMLPFVRGTKPTVIIVTAGNEVDVDRILAAITTATRTLEARSQKPAPFVVLGNNSWNQYVNIDRTQFFNNNVVQFQTYHTRRSAQNVRRFDKRFIREFGKMPSRYAYRGYDAAVMFVKALYNSMDSGMEGVTVQPLLTPYTFKKDSVSGLRVNSQWVKVRYHSNYTITSE